MNRDEWLKWLQSYADSNGRFKLNPDSKHAEQAVEGALANEQKFGLKLCPCRLRDGTREKDLELLCPCNFFIQNTWKEKGRCWCGLFVKTKL